MRCFVLFLVLLCLPLGAAAQVARASKAPAAEVAQAEVRRGVGVHLMPFSFVNGFSRFRFGAQYKWSRWAVLLDLETGSDYTQSLVRNNASVNYNFRGIRPEIRFSAIPTYQPVYLGLELPLTDMRRRVSGRFTRTDGSRVSVTDALQERVRVSVIAKLGIQHVEWDRLFVDVYIGLGAARRNLTYSEASEERMLDEEVFDEWGLFGGSGLAREGVTVVPELAAGFRVGYWFNKRAK